MSMEEHRLLSGFLNSKVGKLRLRIVSIQVIPVQVAQTKTWRKFTKLSTQTDRSTILEIAGRLGLSHGTCQ
jgi:hypothetical protein